jgi:iron complex transport system ATP-binding protein
VIVVEEVTVRYGRDAALAGVSARVENGEWAGLIGANGAGKTTLLRAIMRLVPFAGRTRLGGAPTDRMSRRDLARLVAYVPQKPELPAEMTVADYILLGRSPHIGYFGFEKATDHEICAGLLDRLDLTRFAGRTLRTLSGGELQRLVLGRALAQEAPILLLDEPTSALDLGRRVDALEIVDALRLEHGLTVLSAMHDLTLAGQFADRLILLADGAVAATGSPSEVLDEAVLSQHFGHQVQVLRSPDGALIVAPRRTA